MSTFISDDEIQAGMIAYLKGRAAIIVQVAVVEIREDQWQGAEFVYPNVRVRLISNRPQNLPGCMHIFDCGIQVYAEDASSQNADKIAGIISSELHCMGFGANSLAFYTRVTNQIPAIRADIRTWRSEVLLTGIVSK